jgi:hypothetical protein
VKSKAKMVSVAAILCQKNQKSISVIAIDDELSGTDYSLQEHTFV